MAYQKPNLPSVHFPAFEEQLGDLSGRVTVITGTTSGTGRVAARTIARKGGRVIMLNRPSERAERVQAELSQAFGDLIHTIPCDLQRFASVREAAAMLNAQCADTGVDVLINNAGIMAMPDEATEDGYDIQMQTNHLSHFLLTRDTFGLLEHAASQRGEARIVNHSSIARKGVKRLKAKYLEARGGDLGGNSASMLLQGARWVRYGQTKLANAAFTAALHRKLRAANSNVKALVAHPGFANTELQVTTAKSGGMPDWNSVFARVASQSEEDGALGILSCALLPEARCGQFYGPGRTIMATRGPAEPFALEAQYDNDKTRALLWNKSCEAIGGDFTIG